MAMMEIAVLTEQVGTGTNEAPFRLSIDDSLQLGESASDGTGTPSEDRPPAINAGLSIITVDENRVSALLTASNAKAIWRKFKDSELSNGLDPDEPPTSEEIVALRNWIKDKYGVSVTKIANWFDTTPSGLANWLSNHTRRELAQKLSSVWRKIV